MAGTAEHWRAAEEAAVVKEATPELQRGEQNRQKKRSKEEQWEVGRGNNKVLLR